jgi:predicted negative regulator of RcsB-dependent stress response
MPSQKLRFDWTVSLGHVASVVIFILGGMFAYTDLKSDVRNTQTEAAAKYRDYDRLWAAQKAIDDEQNAKIIRSFQALTEQIRDLKNDLRSDIRETRKK